MSVSAALEGAGFKANDLNTEAILDVDLASLKITGIHLDLKASMINGVSVKTFLVPKAQNQLYRIRLKYTTSRPKK